MSDFYQTGVIATFHRLGRQDLERIESELSVYAAQRPIALVLPSLYSELQAEALKGIVRELQAVKYIRQIVVALGPCNDDEFKHAKDFFSALPQETHIIWNSGPRMVEIYRALDEHGLSAGPDGKGKSAWMAYGYILASGKADVIALHDCDILTYSRDLLARLVYPVVSPNTRGHDGARATRHRQGRHHSRIRHTLRRGGACPRARIWPRGEGYRQGISRKEDKGRRQRERDRTHVEFCSSRSKSHEGMPCQYNLHHYKRWAGILDGKRGETVCRAARATSQPAGPRKRPRKNLRKKSSLGKAAPSIAAFSMLRPPRT